MVKKSGIVLLVVGILVLATTFYLASYMNKKLDEGIEESRMLDPEEMKDQNEDFYEKEDDTRRYTLYGIVNATEALAENVQYEEVGPVRILKTKHRLVVDTDDEANTVTYVDFPVSFNYFNAEDEALANTSVTMFNQNYYAFHALNGEIQIVAGAVQQLVGAAAGNVTIWNAQTGMQINATQYSAMTAGPLPVGDTGTVGMLMAHPTYAASITDAWAGVDVENLTALAMYLGGVYATAVPATLKADGMEMIATHTVDEWLFGWDSMLMRGKAPGITSRATYTDEEILAMTDENRTLASNVNVYTIMTGSDKVENAETLVSFNGGKELAWAPLVAGDGEYEWTSFNSTPNTKKEINGWPGIGKDETLSVWDHSLGRADLAFKEETEVKGIDTLQYRINVDERNFTKALEAKLSQSGDIFNPVYIYAGGSVSTDIEPLSGMGFRADKKIDFCLRPGGSDDKFKLYQIHEYGEIEDDDAEEFKDKVYGTQDMAKNVKLGGAIIGIAFILIGILVLLKRKKAPKDNS